MATGAHRFIVAALERTDRLIDEVAYRPAVVRAFRWLPRWYLCDIARASIHLDDRWETGWWDHAWMPGPPCRACGRRASVKVIDSPDGTEIELCGWCDIRGPVVTMADLDRELDRATAHSVAWRWR